MQAVEILQWLQVLNTLQQHGQQADANAMIRDGSHVLISRSQYDAAHNAVDAARELMVVNADLAQRNAVLARDASNLALLSLITLLVGAALGIAIGRLWSSNVKIRLRNPFAIVKPVEPPCRVGSSDDVSVG